MQLLCEFSIEKYMQRGVEFHLHCDQFGDFFGNYCN